MLVASAAIYGTHYVLLRALKSVGGEPLPTVFVTFVRYQFLMLFAALLRGFRAFQSSIASVPIASTPAAKASATSKASAASKAAQLPASGLKFWLHATELALYTLVSALLGIYGSQLVPAITSEILGSTMHLFVPVLTLVLLRRADFGARTWAGCALAFGAALVTAYAGADGNGGGAAGGGANGARMLGQLALIGYAFFFSLQRVRTQVHLRSYASEALNTARMLSMGALSFIPLLLDTALGGASRRTLTRLGYVLPAQWGLMALSVFLSAFVTSSLMFNAYTVISAANAQPFTALQMPFAALWSLLLIKEPISFSAIAGGTLMLIATLLAYTDKKAGAK